MHDARETAPEARPRSPWPPREVTEVTGMHLALCEEQLPGLVEGLYLHGSIGFGEWHPRDSDVDFVAVTGRRPGEAELRTLRDIHDQVGETFPRPPYDGFYVTWDDLARTPYDCPDVPCILAGQWSDEGRMDVHPVTWHELAWHGITIRGPRLADVRTWTDQKVLREYTHANLEGYWANEVEQLKRFPSEAARPDIVAWFVLGTARLHHLLATDRLTSKNGAGHYAIEAFGEQWRPLVSEALAFRAIGELAGILGKEALAAQVVAFSDMVVRTGLEIPV